MKQTIRVFFKIRNRFFEISFYLFFSFCLQLLTLHSSAQNIVLSSPFQVAADNVHQGSTRYPLSSFQLDVTGANATLNSVSFTTAGTYPSSDIAGFYVMF